MNGRGWWKNPHLLLSFHRTIVMFWQRNKIKKDMIQNIRPTSKVSLKMSCLYTCNGDVDKAERLYAFLIKDMEDLPTFDVQQPTTMQQIKDGAIQTFGWISQNQETIMNWAGIIKDLFGKGGKSMPNTPNTSTPIPSINSK